MNNKEVKKENNQIFSAEELEKAFRAIENEDIDALMARKMAQNKANISHAKEFVLSKNNSINAAKAFRTTPLKK